MSGNQGWQSRGPNISVKIRVGLFILCYSDSYQYKFTLFTSLQSAGIPINSVVLTVIF